MPPVLSDGPVALVNPLQGTDSSFSFSTGNTLPLIALPHGMTHWSPQTAGANSGWFFHPKDRVWEGIRATHQPSPWMGDYGCFVLMPQTGPLLPEAAARRSSFRPEETICRPDRYRTYLTRYECAVEFAPTERCAVLNIELLAPNTATVSRRLLLDLFPGEYHVAHDPGGNRITGYTRHHHGGVPENFAFYFVIAIDAPITAMTVTECADGHHVAAIEMEAGGSSFTARVGTSFISREQAQHNLEREVGERSVAEVAAEAADRWNELLSRVTISGATDDQRCIFYSCLYRSLLFPRKFHEMDREGRMRHYSPYDGTVHAGVLYADNGFWDTFRTVYPLLSLVYPDRLGEIIDGWLNAYRESGWLPEWSSPGHRACMIGTHSHAVLADAVVKGIMGFDYETALAAVVKAAMVPVPDGSAYGREALEEYDRLGYVSCERISKATSRTLDYAYDDYCIAQIARVLGKDALYRRFIRQSERWKSVFDTETQFFRGRRASGAWQAPFDEYEWGGPFVEGGAWQFRFSAPHDPQGLATLVGGSDALAALIARMVAEPARYSVGTYRQEIHEMTEMAQADIGQYAHSNQPVHSALFMAAAVGHPRITNALVHRVLNELYTPDTFPGDEDNGEMAAWYVLAALGLGPLCPGSGNYTLIAPLFPEATITLPSGAVVRIVGNSSMDGDFHVTWNGVPVASSEIAHAVLIAGGELRFGR